MMEPTAPQAPTTEQATVAKTKVCPLCKYVVQPSWYFCPNCSKKLKMKPLSTSIWKQIGVYLVSIIVPPFGLFPAVNYLRQSNWKARIIGIVCILLTILSIVLLTWYTEFLIKQIQNTEDPGLKALQQLEVTN